MNELQKTILAPMAYGAFPVWLRVLRDNGGVELRYLHRAAYVSAMSLAGAPVRLLERLLYGGRIAATELCAPPLFILGHWRSGTTLVHNLLCRDPRLGYVTTAQAFAPGFFLIGRYLFRPFVERLIPKTRPQDNVELHLDLPQEEEIPLAGISPYSTYHMFMFPRRMEDYFARYVLFDGVSNAIRDEWKASYLSLLKKAAFNMPGRRLVLKNPVNTARIRLLLELFPEAKFIHIYRNPYVLFPSTQRMYKKILEFGAFQRISKEEAEENIFDFYVRMMERYFAEKDLIPPENLVEVRYEDFERDPLGGLEQIYAQLGLPGFEEARPHFTAYFGTQAGYRKNIYRLSEAIVARITERWRFTIERWGYSVPEEIKPGE